MIRTQISLEAQEYKLLKREAAAQGISIAEFVRQAIREKLPRAGERPWMCYAGDIESGNPQASQHIDDVIYDAWD